MSGGSGAVPDVRGRLMLAFSGTSLPPAVEARLREAPAAGITLYRYENVETPSQVRELLDAAQAAAASRDAADGPLLIAGDQEGGQLIGLGDGTTPFPGSMAIGATGDLELRLVESSLIRPLAPTLAAAGVNLVSTLGSTNAFVGFTSGTGSAFGNHDILSWEFRNTFAPIVTPPGTPGAVPEPSTYGIFGAAVLVGALAWNRRRKQA